MDDNFSNPNIEWKKSGFGSSEKLSLKINPREAAAYNAKKKNAIQQASPLTASDLPAGLKKIRNKIKDVFDDDEDDEENVSVVIAPALMENNSLLNALDEDEKKILRQQETFQQIKMQQDAGKLGMLAEAHKLAQEAGLKGLRQDTINNNMLNPAVDRKFMENIVKKDLAKSLKIKDVRLEDGKYIQVLRGISNIRKMGGVKAVEGLNLQQVAQAADEKKAAQVLLEKTGRSDAKKQKPFAKKRQEQQAETKPICLKRIYPCICSALKNLRRAENRFLHRSTKNYNCFARGCLIKSGK